MYNVIDYVIIGVLLISLIYGLYRGGIMSSLNTVGFFISWIAGWVYYPRMAESILTSNKGDTWKQLTRYLDGSKSLKVEEKFSAIGQLSQQAIQDMLTRCKIPYPFDIAIQDNLANTSKMAKLNLTTTGHAVDYTVTSVAVNIVCFVVIVVATYLIICAILNLIQYVLQTPLLRQFDWLVGGVMGLLRGYFFIQLIAAVIPIGLFLAKDVAMVGEIFAQSRLLQSFIENNYILHAIGHFV